MSQFPHFQSLVINALYGLVASGTAQSKEHGPSKTLLLRPRPAGFESFVQAGPFDLFLIEVAQNRLLGLTAAPGNPPPRIPGRRGCRNCGGRLRRDRAVSRSGVWFTESATKALGTASRSGSGEGMTAASATAGCSISTLSNSNGLMR